MTSRPYRKTSKKRGSGCGKRRFRDQQEAKSALANCQRKAADSPRRREVRYYKCPECKGWHLSSKSERFWENGS